MRRLHKGLLCFRRKRYSEKRDQYLQHRGQVITLLANSSLVLHSRFFARKNHIFNPKIRYLVLNDFRNANAYHIISAMHSTC